MTTFKGSSEWKAKTFDIQRDDHAQGVRNFSLPQFVKRDDGWILFGPQDVRSTKPKYNFALQYLACDKTIRVRVGCRFKTLPQAWKHWGQHQGKNRGIERRNECAQAVAIIQLMLLQAQQYRLLHMYRSKIRFDSSLVKRKK